MKLDVKNPESTQHDKPFAFKAGLERVSFPDGSNMHADYQHFDKGPFICTKMTLDPALRDPQGRCAWCLQGDEPKKVFVTNMIILFCKPATNCMQLVYAPEEPTNYTWTWVRLNEAKAEKLGRIAQQYPQQFGMLDLLAECEDEKWQKVSFQAIGPAHWQSTQAGREAFTRLYPMMRKNDEFLASKVGRHIPTLEAQMEFLQKRAAKQQGTGAAAGVASALQMPASPAGWPGLAGQTAAGSFPGMAQPTPAPGLMQPPGLLALPQQSAPAQMAPVVPGGGGVMSMFGQSAGAEFGGAVPPGAVPLMPLASPVMAPAPVSAPVPALAGLPTSPAGWPGGQPSAAAGPSPALNGGVGSATEEQLQAALASLQARTTGGQ